MRGKDPSILKLSVNLAELTDPWSKLTDHLFSKDPSISKKKMRKWYKKNHNKFLKRVAIEKTTKKHDSKKKEIIKVNCRQNTALTKLRQQLTSKNYYGLFFFCGDRRQRCTKNKHIGRL